MNFIWATSEVANTSVTIYETNITLNKAACEYFKNVNFVLLGFDHEKKILAIKPVTKEVIDQDIYPRSQLHRLSMGKSYGRISNKSFLKDIFENMNIDLKDGQGIKYNATYDVMNSLLTIQL